MYRNDMKNIEQKAAKYDRLVEILKRENIDPDDFESVNLWKFCRILHEADRT